MKKHSQNTISGILRVDSIELPPRDEAQAKRFEDMNEQLKDMGIRSLRMATDWGYARYDELPSNIVDSAKKEGRLAPKYIADQTYSLKSGDLVKIFKTVADGDVLWNGKIDFDRTNYHHGYQKDVSSTTWSVMFFDALPARLVRDGKEIFGALEPFAETGTEGVIWSLQEYGKTGYDALHCLQDGDELTVYSAVCDGEVEWEGTLDFKDVSPQPVSEDRKWTEIVRVPKHMDAQKWLDMTYQNRPVIITPKI